MDKYSNWSIGGNVVRDNERYIVKDNNELKNLVLSSTYLRPGQQTNGHEHKGQEEVYFFHVGNGTIQVGNDMVQVTAGDTVLIPDGAFHKVFNDSDDVHLYFTCVFNGAREDK